MDLNYDYGDVVHTHGHIHTKPDSHKQVVEHALKEWCHTLFGEDAEEKSLPLINIGLPSRVLTSTLAKSLPS